MRAKAADLWNTFWHAPASTLGLGLFRIAFALCLWREVDATLRRSQFAVEGGFHLPYVSFLPPVSEQVYEWMHTLQYPFIALLALGLFMRTSCAILLALQGYVFFADQLNFRNHPYLFLLLLFLLLFSHANESVSARSLRRIHIEYRPILPALLGSDRPLTIQRLIQVQVCLVYVYAAIHKLHAFYLNGEVLAHQVTKGADRLSGMLGPIVGPDVAGPIIERMQSADANVVPAFVSVGLELVLPFALWFRITRVPAMVVGVVFHLAIAVLMNIHSFSYAVIASYLLFLDPDTLPRWLRARFGDRDGASAGEADSARI